MSRRPNVFVAGKYFIVLDGLIGGRVTGEKQDTITVFYRGGDSIYFHVGETAEEILYELSEELKRVKIYDQYAVDIKEEDEDFNQ